MSYGAIQPIRIIHLYNYMEDLPCQRDQIDVCECYYQILDGSQLEEVRQWID